ncbi:MAG: FAD-dependent oxidoreductase [Rhodospirillales bacterium]|jgi:aspartate oxidase|nr:FAD-dependent oxidoreductase [Rhodospirillales bacterium]
MKNRHADVWIVGSGAAGLMAAIAASGAGVRVGVIGKEAPGRGTATERAGGAFAGAWGGLSEEEQIERTLLSGRGINRLDLVRVLAADGPDRFRDLIDWGMPHRTTRGALHVLAPDGELGETPMWSIEIVRCLAAKAGELGITFIDDTVVAEIRAGEDGVRLTAHVNGGGGGAEPVQLLGGAVVLAAGGAGGIYLHNDNPPRMTGNAHALALDAGAELQDMEFMQFYPMILAEAGKPRLLIAPDEANLGRIHNRQGEDILDKYGITERPAARLARDSLSQAMFQEMELDGNEIFIDLSGLTREAWLQHNLAETRFDFLQRRYDAFARPLLVAPVAHFSVGGARIDENGATSVAGLYAAGEAAGGLHGANRMGGNSLAETVVFGHRAGRAAATYAAGRDQGRAQGQTLGGGAPPAPMDDARVDGDQLLQDLRAVMWRHAGIRRDAEGLAIGLGRVREIGAEAAKAGDRPVELGLAAQTAELIIEAASRRQESRGVHFRADFPEIDDANWLGNLKVARRAGRLDWRFDAVD